MRYKFAFLAALVVCAATSLSLAEIAPRPAEELAKAKTIVVGAVNAAYKDATRDKNWENIKGVVEIKVESVERGEGIKAGDIIFARFWNQHWIGNGNPPPHGTGHHLQKNDAKVRAHLEWDNGAYKIVLPNGLVAIEKEKPTAAR